MSMDDERHPAERLASAAGRNPAEVAAVDRCLAGLRELAVAKFNLGVAVENTSRSLMNLAAMLNEVERQMRIDEAGEIASHPDLAELNVQMDGFYS